MTGPGGGGGGRGGEGGGNGGRGANTITQRQLNIIDCVRAFVFGSDPLVCYPGQLILTPFPNPCYQVA